MTNKRFSAIGRHYQFILTHAYKYKNGPKSNLKIMLKKTSCGSDPNHYATAIIILCLLCFQQINGENYTFGIIPKRTNYFYNQVLEGCRNWDDENKFTQNGDIVKLEWLNVVN